MIDEKELNINNSTTKLLYAIYQSLERLNEKLDKFLPKEEEKSKKKKGA